MSGKHRAASGIPAAFSWFDSPSYCEERIPELREQIAAMDEESLWTARQKN